jgi:UDP-glucose 4-epimerase
MNEYKRKILITGGAGNIGSSLAKRLAAEESNYVVIADNLSTGNLNRLPARKTPNWRFVKLDVNQMDDLSPVMCTVGFDYVFHYAAVVGVKRTLENPLRVMADIDGIRNVLSLSKNTGVKRVFFSSSSEVYGEPFEIPQNENTTPLNSRLPYAIVKNLGESFFKCFQREFGLDYTIFRFFNTFGPQQSEDFVLPRFVNAALQGEDLTIYGDGSQTRTFCYVDDNIETTVRALYHDLAVNDTLNIGSDRELTILQLAELVLKRVGGPSKLRHLPPLAEGDMTRRCPDITNMKRILGRDLLPLEAGVDKLIEYKRATLKQ